MPKKKKRKNKSPNKLIRIIMYLVFLIIIFNIVPNYEVKDKELDGKINLIIDNTNVTNNLEKGIYINNKNVIYISKEDISQYFDQSINYDEDNNQIITTYGEKTVKLPLNQNIIFINERKVDVLSGAIEKENTYYVPISALAKIYEIDIQYIKQEQILLLDSLTKKLVKADISKKSDVKLKPTAYSRTVDKLNKADKVVVIENSENNWTKIRTKSGIIGYVKTNILQNIIHIRDDLNYNL